MLLKRAIFFTQLFLMPTILHAQTVTSPYDEGVVTESLTDSERAEIARYGGHQGTRLEQALLEAPINCPHSHSCRALYLYETTTEIVPMSASLEKENSLLLRYALNQGRNLYDLLDQGTLNGPVREAVMQKAFLLAKSFYATDLEYLKSNVRLENSLPEYASMFLETMTEVSPVKRSLKVAFQTRVLELTLKMLQSKGNLKRDAYALVIEQLERAISKLNGEKSYKTNAKKWRYLKKKIPELVLSLKKKLN